MTGLIGGRRRVVIGGATSGLGLAIAQGLAAQGAELLLWARNQERLDDTARRISAEHPDATVHVLAADAADPDASAQVASAATQLLGGVDILILNAGGPPPGDFRQFSRDDWIKALDSNMLTPIELIKKTLDGMIERGFGRVVNITSSSVKAPIDVLGLSNGARSGLTGFVAGLSRKVAATGVTINNLLPGSFDTDRLVTTFEADAKANNISVEEAKKRRMSRLPAGRFGTSEEFGKACAYLCSVHAGYITGQNLLIDGGAYPGTY